MTDTWRGIQDNLTSDSTTSSLSAAQGKVLKGLVDGKAASNHTHKYAGSSSVGGAANSAIKLTNARNFSITGGAAASAISFDGSNNVALNVTYVSTDVLNNGSNTLILNCGGAA